MLKVEVLAIQGGSLTVDQGVPFVDRSQPVAEGGAHMQSRQQQNKGIALTAAWRWKGQPAVSRGSPSRLGEKLVLPALRGGTGPVTDARAKELEQRAAVTKKKGDRKPKGGAQEASKWLGACAAF